eukprot:scaffold703_cov168-Amphora_coffeaeformis.AAC.28
MVPQRFGPVQMAPSGNVRAGHRAEDIGKAHKVTNEFKAIVFYERRILVSVLIQKDGEDCRFFVCLSWNDSFPSQGMVQRVWRHWFREYTSFP